MSAQKEKNDFEFVKLLVKKCHNYRDYMELGIFTHPVHGMCTLFALGGSKELIEEYYESAGPSMEPLQKPRFVINESNWEKYIGDTAKGAYAEYFQFFDEQITTHGVKPTLNKFIPRLLPGFFGFAPCFYPLTQIGFGVEYDLPLVVAEGLSYCCVYYNPIGEVINQIPAIDNNDPSSTELLDIINSVQSTSELDANNRKAGKHITVEEEFKFTEFITKWKVNAESYDEILKMLTELTRAIVIVTFGAYPQGRDTIDAVMAQGVITLHTVRILLPYLSLHEQNRLLQVAYAGLMVIYWHQGKPKFDMKRIMEYGGPIAEMSWEKIIQAALSHDHEHLWKVVRSLLVIRDSTSNEEIPHELLQRSAFMTVNLIKMEEDWDFYECRF